MNNTHYTKHYQLCDNALDCINNGNMHYVNLRDHMKQESENEICAVEDTLIKYEYASRNELNKKQIRIKGEGIRFVEKGKYKSKFEKEAKNEKTENIKGWKERNWLLLSFIGYISGILSGLLVAFVKPELLNLVPQKTKQENTLKIPPTTTVAPRSKVFP